MACCGARDVAPAVALPGVNNARADSECSTATLDAGAPTQADSFRATESAAVTMKPLRLPP